MAKKLYVGGLSYDTYEGNLEKTFDVIGTAETAVVINDRETGRSKGFGFVEMSTEDEAKKAIETLNGKELDGRTIIVNEARPHEARPRSGGFDRGRRY